MTCALFGLVPKSISDVQYMVGIHWIILQDMNKLFASFTSPLSRRFVVIIIINLHYIN